MQERNAVRSGQMTNIYNSVDIVTEAKKKTNAESAADNIPRLAEVDLTPFIINYMSGDRLNAGYSADAIIKYMRTTALITPQQPIETKKLGIIGSFFVFVKKTIRKMIEFYVVPIVHEQNKFNMNVVDALEHLNNEIKKRDNIIEDMQKRVSDK